MAKKIDLSLLDNIEEKLNSQEEWQSEINLRELVGRLFSSIDTAVQRKASWDKIAKFIQEAIRSDELINPNTLRQYYFHFKSNPKELPKKKRKASNSKKKRKAGTPQASASTINLDTPERPEISQESKLETQSGVAATAEVTPESLLKEIDEVNRQQSQASSFSSGRTGSRFNRNRVTFDKKN